MKIVLLQPPIEDFYDTSARLQPLGLACLKSCIEQRIADAQVVIKDYRAGWGRFTVKIPSELAYLRKIYKYDDRGPFSTFHRFYHFGASYEQLAADVAGERPDLVGISCLFSAYHREAVRTAEAIKKQLDVKIAAGGAHATSCPASLLESGAFDYVISGGGERPLCFLLDALAGRRTLHDVPNLVFKENGQVTANAVQENFPLADLPAPDFTGLKAGNYRYRSKAMAFVLTSRGCPYRCRFCSARANGTYERRSTAAVLEEIKQRYDEGIRVFDFEDDSLCFDRDHFKQLCRLLARELPPEKGVEFLAMNGISYFDLDKEALQLMRLAGFSRLNLSLVSANASVCKSMQRRHDLGHFTTVVREAFTLGFAVTTYFILGLPGEELDSMMDTISFAAHLPVFLGASPFYHVPGAAIAADFQPLTSTDLVRARLTALDSSHSSCTSEQLFTFLVASRIINFVKTIPQNAGDTSLGRLWEAAERNGGRQWKEKALLRRIVTDNRLYGGGPKGERVRVNEAFDALLFERLWSQLAWVSSAKGGRITLNW